MSDNLKFRLCLLAGLLVISTGKIVFGATGNSKKLVSPKLLEQAKLEILWENELPIKTGESLEQLDILGERIYALSNHNYLISLDRQKGNMIFGSPIALAGLPISGMQLYEDKLISIVGNRVVETDLESGEKLSSWDPEFGIACPIARNSSYFYLAGTDKRLRVLRAEDMVRAFEVAADNDSAISSVIADENIVIFTTEGGNVISFMPDSPERLWQFDAAGSIIGPIVQDGSSLFFACKDTNVYRIDMVDAQRVNLVWKCQTNAVLDKSPYVTTDIVYQRADDKGLAAIDKKSGEPLWQLVEGTDLLAEARGKAYVITKNKTLAVIDNNRKKRLYSVNFTQVSLHAANTTGSEIYIADKNGRIACIKPVE